MEPTIFGPIMKPNLSRVITQPSLGVSPPKGRTLKRSKNSREQTNPPSKRQVITIRGMQLKPSWMTNSEKEEDNKEENNVVSQEAPVSAAVLENNKISIVQN